MTKKKILKIGLGIVTIIVVVFVILVYKEYRRIEKEEIRRNEAAKISNIAKKLNNLHQLYDINNKNVIDEELRECDKILEELHKENSSGKIYDESLKSIMDNSIGAVENNKKSLEAFKNGDMGTFSEFSKKSSENISKLNNELERLGSKK